MSGERSRREILAASALVAGGSLLGAVPARADDPPPPTPPGNNPPIPDVPGMLGDPRANEFFYQFDQYFYFHRPDSLVALLDTIQAAVGPVTQWRTIWLNCANSPGYPDTYRAIWKPVEKEVAELSRLQRLYYHGFWRYDLGRIIPAFEEMAQGRLWDPRLPDGSKLHVMDPPSGGTEAYHRWHATNRAMILLGIDAAWWSALDPIVGYAWSIQSLAQPVKDSQTNPLLPRDAMRQLRRDWLCRTPHQLDEAFKSFPYPTDLPKI